MYKRQAAPLLEPTITAAKQKGFTPLLDLAAANTPWIFDGVVVTNGYLKEHRDALTHFVRAYIAGAYLALSDVEKAKALIAQKYKTSDPTVIDATYNDFKRLMPVSYTHLDVYKRQILRWPRSGPRRMNGPGAVAVALRRSLRSHLRVTEYFSDTPWWRRSCRGTASRSARCSRE